jgi:hypothetical protein
MFKEGASSRWAFGKLCNGLFGLHADSAALEMDPHHM